MKHRVGSGQHGAENSDGDVCRLSSDDGSGHMAPLTLESDSAQEQVCYAINMSSVTAIVMLDSHIKL